MSGECPARARAKNEDTGGVVRNGGDPGYIGMEALRTMVPSYTIADHAGQAPITDALVLHDHFYSWLGWWYTALHGHIRFRLIRQLVRVRDVRCRMGDEG